MTVLDEKTFGWQAQEAPPVPAWQQLLPLLGLGMVAGVVPVLQKVVREALARGK